MLKVKGTSVIQDVSLVKANDKMNESIIRRAPALADEVNRRKAVGILTVRGFKTNWRLIQTVSECGMFVSGVV